MKKLVSVFFLMILILTCSMNIYAAPGEIVVNGEGSINVEPDIAYISLGVNVSAPAARDAQAKNAALMTKVISDLTYSGIKAKDIQTTNFNLYPEYRYNKDSEPGQVIGYQATNQVTVTVRNIRKVGEVIDLSIKAGANNINHVTFSVSSPDDWRNKAIEAAVKDAQAKAELMAKAANVTIKKVLSISESNVSIRPLQMDTMFKSAAGSAAFNTPVEAGNVKVAVNIQMKFEI